MQATSQKYLDIILDTRLSFEKHLETVLCKINNTIGLIRKLQNLLPRYALITLHKLSNKIIHSGKTITTTSFRHNHVY